MRAQARVRGAQQRISNTITKLIDGRKWNAAWQELHNATGTLRCCGYTAHAWAWGPRGWGTPQHSTRGQHSSVRGGMSSTRVVSFRMSTERRRRLHVLRRLCAATAAQPTPAGGCAHPAGLWRHLCRFDASRLVAALPGKAEKRAASKQLSDSMQALEALDVKVRWRFAQHKALALLPGTELVHWTCSWEWVQ
jgi:hypothetical protein